MVNKMTQKIEVDLVSWIRDGLLGPVAVGQNKDKVRKLLSPPLGWASTETMDEIDDYMIADIWGYGVWTLYFEGDILDAVTCSIEQLDEHGWYFEVGGAELSFLCNKSSVKGFLERYGIPFKQIDEPFYTLKNPVTGETTTHRRRLSVKTVLAGTDFKTRILFDKEDEHIKVMAYPFSAEGQVVSNKRCLAGKGYILL